MEDLFWKLVMGLAMGSIVGYLTRRTIINGWIGNLIAGTLGAWIGDLLLGEMGLTIAGIHIIPAIMGSGILLIIYHVIFSIRNNVEH